ncbi:MAG: type II toxin-antitoxin system PemK/MazF family toxin [Desulfobacterales bacterium]|nr:type II toxin-antitoxin system PemK/MazF family toxin [Desulfobacterales bacterium]
MEKKCGKKIFIPDRGDFIYIDFDPQAGHEQSGKRPAIVLTPAFYNKASQMRQILQ